MHPLLTLVSLTVDVANSLTPPPIPGHKLAQGVEGGVVPKHQILYDTAKEAKILGIKYSSKEDLARDTLADFAKRGWY